MDPRPVCTGSTQVRPAKEPGTGLGLTLAASCCTVEIMTESEPVGGRRELPTRAEFEAELRTAIAAMETQRDADRAARQRREQADE